jgi:hypothetical protein
MTQNDIAWCRAEQASALEHLRHGKCEDFRCCPEGNARWLAEAFAEELLIEQAIGVDEKAGRLR